MTMRNKGLNEIGDHLWSNHNTHITNWHKLCIFILCWILNSQIVLSITRQLSRLVNIQNELTLNYCCSFWFHRYYYYLVLSFYNSSALNRYLLWCCWIKNTLNDWQSSLVELSLLTCMSNISHPHYLITRNEQINCMKSCIVHSPELLFLYLVFVFVFLLFIRLCNRF